MINTFDNYLKLGKVKRQTINPDEAKALLIQSEERLDYVNSKEINQTSAKFVLQDSYESIRESAQSLMSMKGFKPYSHEATISFLKKFHEKDFTEEEIFKFDRFRQLRNDSVYKAIIITEEEAKDCLSFAKQFVKKIKNIKKDY